MKILKIILLNLLILSSLIASDLQSDSQELLTNSYSKKETVILDLTKKYKSEKKFEYLLQKLLAGDLYYTKNDNRIVFLKEKKRVIILL